MTTSPPEEIPATSRRDLAVARSLDPARARAQQRVQRFLDAAVELMSTSPQLEFTVQEVVEKSGQSLRSFYQYFAGKHELLLALFEEAVSATTDRLAIRVAGSDDPLERLQAFADEYYRVCRPGTPGRTPKQKNTPSTSVMAGFAQQLLTDHPKEATNAFAPLVTMLSGLLDDAAEAGAIRAGLDNQQVAGVLLQTVMFNSFGDTISGRSTRDVDADTDADRLWELLLHGIGASPPR